MINPFFVGGGEGYSDDINEIPANKQPSSESIKNSTVHSWTVYIFYSVGKCLQRLGLPAKCLGRYSPVDGAEFPVAGGGLLDIWLGLHEVGTEV